MWKPRPKSEFYNMHYKDIDKLNDNIKNKFTKDEQLWNGISKEIDELTFAEHPYWVLNHP